MEEQVISKIQVQLVLVMQGDILRLKETMVDLLDLIQVLDLKLLEEAVVVQVQMVTMDQLEDLEDLEDRELLIQLQDHLSQEAAVAEDLQEKLEEQEVQEALVAEVMVQVTALWVEQVELI